MNIYIAAPLFNETELERNRKLRDFLKGLGFETYLPQEDGGIAYDEIREGADIAATRRKMFDGDVAAVKACDALVCVLDGRVPDDGACIELGMAHALGKTCVGYRTDKRTLDPYGPSLMIEGCLKTVAHSLEELKVVLGR